MEPEEIRAEINRRKQRAKDLKLRETVWSLYSSQFKYVDDKLRKDPELILPEVRETLVRSNTTSDFRFNGAAYRLGYIEGKKESDGWGDDETVTTPGTIMLTIDGTLVFEFRLRTSVTYAPDAPIFHESMGEITAFIEGPWVTDVSDLLVKMRTHFQGVWKMRNAPKEAAQLKQDMKRFGI